MDGTLLNSKPGITGSMKKVLKQFGLPEQPDRLMEMAIGPTIEYTFQEIFGFTKEYRPEVEAYMNQVYAQEGMLMDKLFPGVQACTKLVKERNGINCIATMKPQHLKDRSIQCNPALGAMIDHWVGREQTPGRLTKEDLIQTALRLAGANPHEAIVIGDRASDILAAKALNITTVAAQYGFGSREELAQAQPDYTVENIDHLHALLGQLLKKR
jgi:phosphoglycolate phosphatase